MRKAGDEKADVNSGPVSSEDSIEAVQPKALGEQQDQAVDSIKDAKEAQADALEIKAEEQRKAAEQKVGRGNRRNRYGC